MTPSTGRWLVEKGMTLKYTGGKRAYVFDKNRHITQNLPVNESALIVPKGGHTITFDCEFTTGEKPLAKIELRLTGNKYTGD